MNTKEMEKRGWSCGNRPFNRTDRIVVEEIWMATAEICKRLDALLEHSGVSIKNEPDPKLVSKLRQYSGASMNDCKKALEDSDWYYSSAVDLIKERHQKP